MSFPLTLASLPNKQRADQEGIICSTPLHASRPASFPRLGASLCQAPRGQCRAIYQAGSTNRAEKGPILPSDISCLILPHSIKVFVYKQVRRLIKPCPGHATATPPSYPALFSKSLLLPDIILYFYFYCVPLLEKKPYEDRDFSCHIN